MPGHNPQEAVRNYLDPLQRVVSCLKGGAKIIRSGKILRVGDVGSWILNGPTGMVLPRFGSFHAQQYFELVECDPERFDLSAGAYRVSTRMYAYKVVFDKTREQAGFEIRWHWHPGGKSPEDRPHIHPSMKLKAHLPSSRHTLEEVVEGVLELGAEASCTDYKARLMETGGIHKVYRTWVNDPSESKTTLPSAGEA